MSGPSIWACRCRARINGARCGWCCSEPPAPREVEAVAEEFQRAHQAERVADEHEAELLRGRTR